MNKLFILIIALFFAGASFSQKTYSFDSTCRLAYKEIIKLKLDRGKELIDKARKNNPDNLIPDLLEGYIDFFVLFFNEDSSQYRIRRENFDKRLAAFDSGPNSSPFYRFSKGLTYLQRAAVKIKFGERYSAGWDFKKANTQIKENVGLYPSFQPNKMLYGPLEVVIGTVPGGYKWITSLFGMSGSINKGMEHMQSLINSDDSFAKLFADEATFYFCYLTFYVENKPDDVFKLIRLRKLDIVNNHLFTYLAANLAINSKQTDYAKQIIEGRNMSPEYMKTAAWYFEMGYVYFHKLQLDSAIHNFTNFIDNFKGQFYVKDVLQKISWAYYLQGNKEEAEKYRLLTIRKGNTDSDADKKAYRDAKKALWPNETLLKARIRNDGGFQKEALALLQEKPLDYYTKPEEKLEYSYRMARIYDDMGKYDEAIPSYQSAIQLGKDRTEYYAARAALQLGFIYEKRNQKALAIAAYQQCLDLGEHEYKDSLDQRAKAGLARCKEE